MANLKVIKGKKGGITYRVLFSDNGACYQKSYKSLEEACYQFYLCESQVFAQLKTVELVRLQNITIQKLAYYYLGYQWDKYSRGVIGSETYYRIQSTLTTIDEALLATSIIDVSEMMIRSKMNESGFVWLRAAFNLLIDKGLLRYNPCPKPKKRKRKSVVIPTLNEVNQLFNSTSDPALRLFFFLCAVCGLRTGEALGLKWTDIVGDTLCVQRHLTARGIVEGTKRGQGREIQVPPEFFTLLTPLNRDSTYLFQGKYLTSHVKYQSFRAHKAKPLFDKLQLNYSNHALRHFAAATWLKEGRNLKEIQVLLGHSTELETLTSYGHLLNKPKELTSVLKVL